MKKYYLAVFLLFSAITAVYAETSYTTYLPITANNFVEKDTAEINWYTSVPVTAEGMYAGTDLDVYRGKNIVSSKVGQLFIMNADGTFEDDSLFMDLSSRVHNVEFEDGFYSIAPHPDVENNGVFFTFYKRITPEDPELIETIVSKFTLFPENQFKLDPASEKVIYRFPDNASIHNGGSLQFGPHDGYLYISMGDDRDHALAVELDNPYGKILRIDVDSAEPFAIPADNPFIDTEDALPEIFAYGLRNPWSTTFDREGNLYIADVGTNTWEEVDYIPADSGGGQFFGWPCWEANLGFDGCRNDEALQELHVRPIFSYKHESVQVGEDTHSRCSISGGAVYYGSLNSGWYGNYIFGDFCSGEVWSLHQLNGEWHDSLVGNEQHFLWTALRADVNNEIIGLSFGNPDLYLFE